MKSPGHKFHCPIHHLSRDLNKTRFLTCQVISTEKWRKWHFCDAPLNFTVFHLKFNPVLERMRKRTDGRPSFFLEVMAAFVFFESLYRSFLTKKDAKKKKTGTAGFRFVGSFMINLVSKHHTQIRKIERGMANPPLWQ